MEGQLEMDGREVCRTKADCFSQRIPSTQKGSDAFLDTMGKCMKIWSNLAVCIIW